MPGPMSLFWVILIGPDGVCRAVLDGAVGARFAKLGRSRGLEVEVVLGSISEPYQ